GTVTHRLTDGESVVVAERSSTTEPAAIYVFQGTDYTGEFDPVYYADRYPDLKNAFGYNADLLLQHYVQYGIGEHRVAKEPAPGEKKYVYGGVDYTNEFDPVYYSDRYPDLKKAFGTNEKLLLQHYVLYGIREHRIAKAPAGGVSEEPEPEPEQEEQSGTRYVYGGVDYTDRFDPIYYADRYPDLKKAFGYDAKLLLQHYVQYGIREHREAKKPQGGAEEDPPEPAEDPKPEGGSGRYVFQGVDYTDEFDPVFYADHYPDLKNAFGTNEQLLLEHYATYGIREHRMGKNPNEGSSGLYVLNGVDYTDVFNPRIYADRYPDLRKAFGYNAKLLLSHYVTHGIREGRKAI
ncbi:MAG: hypothetical protein IK088_03905, partial [Lachnospiraceae bacterium]|nr:hypothetical protein [Lachnospiraceae bacterium]